MSPKKFAPLISMESNLEKWYEKNFFPESCHSLELQEHNFEKLTFLNISRLSCSLWNICSLCAMDFRKYFLTISVFSTEFTFQIFISNGHSLWSKFYHNAWLIFNHQTLQTHSLLKNLSLLDQCHIMVMPWILIMRRYFFGHITLKTPDD